MRSTTPTPEILAPRVPAPEAAAPPAAPPRPDKWDAAPPLSAGRMRPQWAVAAAAGIAIAALSLAAGEIAPRLGAAALIGALAGVSLYHAAFGFTSGWRRFVRERRGAGLRAQLLLVALTAAAALPLIATVPGIGGFVFPLGVAVLAGAFLFGVGMQLAGGCGSGTLFTVGGGSTRMLLALAAFIAGGLVATFHWTFWDGLPRLPALSLATPLGVPGAIAATVLALALLAALTARAERARHGALEPRRPPPSGAALWRGPWPLGWGVAGLTLTGILTLLVLGRPWGITSGLTLSGAQIAWHAGVPLDTWPYWQGAMAAVSGSPLADGTSVMNFGLVAGAMLAAGLAGRFRPTLRLSGRDVATAVLGGFLMGYGARIAFGCNIGALLGGIASGSLHGWGWFAAAFAGSLLGIRARVRLGMDAPPAPPHAAR